MNKGFYSDLDTNFTQAYSLCEGEFCHAELLELLKTGNIPEKQIAALKFDCVNNQEDANALIENLTGCDGKIREAVALKINQILQVDDNSLHFFNFPQIFANATIDINGNICRLVVDSACILKRNKEFAKNYTNAILIFTEQALSELDKFIFRDKKYVINKQIFKLYWCLEALKHFYEYVEGKKLLSVLEKCSLQSEYTIREKVAQILVLSGKFEELAETLKTDDNYYVRNVF